MVPAGSSPLDYYELPEVPPADFKQLKKDMQHALFYFRRLLDGGKRPSSVDIERYRHLQAAFARTAKRDWAGAVDEADAATDRLARAASEGDLPAASAAVEELLGIKKIYHDRYKQG